MADEVLGIDVGGTGIKGAPVNVETGELTGERFRIKTPQPATPEAMVAVMGEVARHFNWHGRIGVGFPAVIRHGIVRTAANIDGSWIGTNIAEMVTKETGCAAIFANDADAAGLAEMHFGAAKGKSGVVMMITLGTGIGSAIFLNGAMYPNAEIGHLIVRGKDAEQRICGYVRDHDDVWANEKTGKHLTEYFHELERLLWPDLFVVGGGGSKEFDALAPLIHIETPMVPAQMLNLAGIVGAALVGAGIGK